MQDGIYNFYGFSFLCNPDDCSGRSINSTLYPSGSARKAITVLPPLTGPASRVTVPPAVRAASQAFFASSTPTAIWP